MERSDPFFVVKEEVLKSLEQAKKEYNTWKNEILSSSQPTTESRNTLRQTLRNIDWDLEDLQETVLIVEKNPGKFSISMNELESRQHFLCDVKSIVRQVRNNMAEPQNVMNINKPISFEIRSQRIAMKSSKPNGFTANQKLGSAHQITAKVGQEHPLLTDQQILMQEQDAHLDQLGNSISTLKNISHKIGGELNDQVLLLDEFGDEMVKTDSKIDSAIKRTAHLLHLDSDRSQWCTIGVLLVTIIIIIILLVIL